MSDSLSPSIDVDGGGVWTGVQEWPLIGIHATLTADNQLLTFGTDELGMQGGQVFYDIWDYQTDTHYTLPNSTGTDIFCSVSVLVPETGDILIIGGDARPLGTVNAGVKDVNVLDTETLALSALPTTETGLTYARWYATAVTLSNGKILVLGGIDENKVGQGTPELYTPGGGFKTLDGAASGAIASGWFYPRAWETSDGDVAIITNLGAGTMYRLDPSGDGSIAYYGDLPFSSANNLPAVMYGVDTFLIMSTAGELWSVNVSGASPVASMVADIGAPRYFSNMTVLANGNVGVFGGGSATDVGGLGTLYTDAVIFSPSTGTVTIGDGEANGRLYHSTAILLPDGSVLSLGGGAPGPFTQLNGEFYYPEMLFESGAGARADAIDILEAPRTIEQRASFQLTVDDPTSVTRVTMVKSGTVTHTLNMETRFIEANFSVDNASGIVTVDPGSNSNILTPGAWMVFVLDENGVPSEAATIMVGLGGERYLPQLGAFVTLNGEADLQAADNEFLLTPDQTWSSGSVVTNQRIDFAQDFTLNVSLYLGDKDAADGMAIAFHNDPYTSDAVGGQGGSLGVSGIANVFGIEFDTWNNAGAEVSDTHSGFITTNGGALTEVGAHTALAPLEDGLWHDVVVIWDAQTQTISYTLDGILIDSLTGDLTGTHFGGQTAAYLAITASTGGAGNNQAVRINGFTGYFEGETSTNTTPLASDDENGPFLISELTSSTGQVLKVDGTNVLVNDTDDDGDGLSIVEINSVAVTGSGWQGWRDASNGGQIAMNTDGRVQFRDPDGDFSQLPLGERAETSITYTISDGNGGTSDATVTYVIEGIAVVGVNSSPEANDDTSSNILASSLNSDGTAVKISGPNVLSNDSDANGDSLTIVAIDGVAVTGAGWQGWRDASQGGQIVLNTDGRVQFRDADGDFANLRLGEVVETSITYTVSDGNGGRDIGTITFVIEGDAITGPNAAPVANDDENGTILASQLYDGTGTARKLEGENVLANDSDPDGDAVAIVAVGSDTVTTSGWQGWRDASNGGQIALNTDGRVRFRDAEFEFADLSPGEAIDTSLEYTISDGNGRTASAMITFTVTADEFELALDSDFGDVILG
ncbi:lectin-like domain-containing protein [Silicimonas sp. MF1-12-2]|uniref:lectin-like domain-containing protein n=1 Tax=Silicimonas sp. MF1-12-2 TaxID=3384793 RepID=UPI0039B67688